MSIISDTALIVPAAGGSTRFGSDKLTFPLEGLPLFLHSVRTVAPLLPPGHIILAVAPQRIEEIRRIAGEYLPEVAITFVPGGSTRTESVFHALEKAAALPGVKYAAVHDAARPFLTAELFTKCVEMCRIHGGALLCRKISDTVKRIGPDGCVAETIDREMLRAAETPQIFPVSELLAATEKALESGRTFTDDAQVMECYTALRPYLVEHPFDNRKITFLSDLK